MHEAWQHGALLQMAGKFHSGSGSNTGLSCFGSFESLVTLHCETVACYIYHIWLRADPPSQHARRSTWRMRIFTNTDTRHDPLTPRTVVRRACMRNSSAHGMTVVALWEFLLDLHVETRYFRICQFEPLLTLLQCPTVWDTDDVC